MCTRPSEPRPRRYPRPTSSRPRWDRDVQNFVRDETEMRRLKSKTRPRQVVAASEMLAETLKLPRLLGASTSRWACFSWHMIKHVDNEKKLCGLINSHLDKCFLFVILWVSAIYFDNYHWIINGLHHKELQLQCCRHEPLCLSQFASNYNL